MPGSFDFGLTTEQEQHARTLHEESISIDLVSRGRVAHRSTSDSRRTKWSPVCPNR